MLNMSVTGSVCRRCPNGCANCTGALDCTTCDADWKLIVLAVSMPSLPFHAGQCVHECPEQLIVGSDNRTCTMATHLCRSNEFWRGRVGKCELCHASCTGCHGASPLDCNECASGYRNVTFSCELCCTKEAAINCGGLWCA